MRQSDARMITLRAGDGRTCIHDRLSLSVPVVVVGAGCGARAECSSVVSVVCVVCSVLHVCVPDDGSGVQGI